jgi:hypothetical protein
MLRHLSKQLGMSPFLNQSAHGRAMGQFAARRCATSPVVGFSFSVMASWLLRSVCPILQLQSFNLAKILGIPSRESGALRQCDATNQEVLASDLSDFLVLPESVEFHGDRVSNGQESKRGQVTFCALKPSLSAHEFGSVCCFQQRSKSTFEYLNAGDRGDCDFIGFRLLARHYALVAAEQ